MKKDDIRTRLGEKKCLGFGSGSGEGLLVWSPQPNQSAGGWSCFRSLVMRVGCPRWRPAVEGEQDRAVAPQGSLNHVVWWGVVTTRREGVVDLQFFPESVSTGQVQPR